MQSVTQAAKKINLHVQSWPLLAAEEKSRGNHKYRKVNQRNRSNSLPNSLEQVVMFETLGSMITDSLMIFQPSLDHTTTCYG